MIHYIIVTIAFLSFYLLYSCILKPKKLHQWYIENFTKKGYKVYQIPFEPLGIPFKRIYNRSTNVQDGLSFLKKEYPKADLVIMNIMNKIYIDFLHPDLVKELLSFEKQMIFQKTKLELDCFRRLGIGIVFSEGEAWKKKRKIVTEIFNFDFLQKLSPKIALICDNAFDQIQKTSKTGPNQYEFNLLDFNLQIFSRVMFQCFFGQKLTSEKIQDLPIYAYLKCIVDDLMAQTSDAIYLLFGVNALKLGLRKKDRQVNKKLKNYNGWGKKVITDKIQQIKEKKKNSQKFHDPTDLMEAIILHKLRQQEEGEDSVYKEEDLLGQFTTFFVAGIDSTSHYLVMIIYLISLHPQVEKKVREQVQTFMENDDYSYENLKNFKYLECVEKQTTRFYGPSNKIFFRSPVVDSSIQGVPIKKGTFVNMQSLGFHYSDKYYNSPTQFRPERWLDECSNLNPYLIGGFGGGAKTCIGKHLARLQAKIGVIKYLKRYKRIELKKQKFRMLYRFMYEPEEMVTKLVKFD